MKIVVLALVLLTLLPGRAAATCNPAQVCSDVAASFWGSIIVDGVRLDWLTDDESGIRSYTLYRVTSAGRVWIASLASVGACGVNKSYTFTDTSPGSYLHYDIDVIATGNEVAACSFSTYP